MNFVFDIDGTISFDGHTIDNRIKEALKMSEHYGHEVIFASARSYRDCVNLLGDELNKKMVVGLNGGLVFNNGEKLLSHDLNMHTFKNVVDFCHEYEIPYFVDDLYNYACQKGEQMPFYCNVDFAGIGNEISVYEMKHPIKMVISLRDNLEKLDYLITIAGDLHNVLVSYHEREFCLYLNPLGITKASTLVDILGNNFIAFGNDKNDIEMFKVAQKSIQIGDFADVKPFSSEQILLEGDFKGKIAERIKELFIDEYDNTKI